MIERELLPAARTYGLGVIPRPPLAGGKLTGKYRPAQTAPPNSCLNVPEVQVLFPKAIRTFNSRRL